ncbi:hypothetical protein DFQ14_101277 [Halopolyspora algeriensis]|uniref:Uncharacterized protein n=1 Tax=Halopolyspora algeriensis TaxID=1500506 RepID=A0A368VY70_9ACTN|nr:hypothetical protein [Halopolyspora algeriensis]RCW46937.1 hypothetical protein DFQ14_101277 [Halopolyspora algeriensis]TQM48028.1 hypothetical protein FHU43_2980 [Halopolyspora algeriensis]
MSDSPKQTTLDGLAEIHRAGVPDDATEQAARWLDKRARMAAPIEPHVPVTAEQIRHTGRVPTEAAAAIADVIATDLDRPIEPDEHGQWPTGWLAADMAALDLAKAVLAHAPAAA